MSAPATDAATWLAEGQRALDARDLEGAERAYGRVLDESADPAARAGALRGLATTYGRAGRVFEALVMSRRAVELARRHRDAPALCRALGLLCTGLVNVPAYDRLDAPLGELGALLATLPGGTGAIAGRMYDSARFAKATHDGEARVAREALASLRARIEHAPLFCDEPRLLTFYEYRLARLSESPRVALERLERLLADAGPMAGSRLAFQIQRAELLAEQAGPDSAHDQAREALDHLGALDGDASLSELRVTEGRRLALLLGRLGDLDGSRRAYELVSTALLHRLRQLADAAGRLEGWELPAGPDEHLLDELRRDFMEAQVRVLQAVAHTLAEAAERGADVGFAAERPGLLRICAWCRSVALSGRWVPLGRFVPAAPTQRVTHGMCAACYKRHRPTALQA